MLASGGGVEATWTTASAKCWNQYLYSNYTRSFFFTVFAVLKGFADQTVQWSHTSHRTSLHHIETPVSRHAGEENSSMLHAAFILISNPSEQMDVLLTAWCCPSVMLHARYRSKQYGDFGGHRTVAHFGHGLNICLVNDGALRWRYGRSEPSHMSHSTTSEFNSVYSWSEQPHIKPAVVDGQQTMKTRPQSGAHLSKQNVKEVVMWWAQELQTLPGQSLMVSCLLQILLVLISSVLVWGGTGFLDAVERSGEHLKHSDAVTDALLAQQD